MPGGKVIDDYHQIMLGDSTIIFAETDDDRVIVERQYRHGAGKVTLVLPAGLIEENETPLEAGQRELLEETGYTAATWQDLGNYALHGNYGCGRAHIFRARGAQLVAQPNSGDLEDIEIVLMTMQELIDAYKGGQMAMMGTMATIALVNSPLIQQDSG